MTSYLARRITLSLVVGGRGRPFDVRDRARSAGRPRDRLGGSARRPRPGRPGAKHLGLDRPFIDQIGTYFGGVVVGHWGTSIHTHRPVLDLKTAVPASLELVIAAILIAIAVGVPSGLLAARLRGRATDHAVRAMAIVGVSMPIFWLYTDPPACLL